jgi:hypothetical protein
MYTKEYLAWCRRNPTRSVPVPAGELVALCERPTVDDFRRAVAVALSDTWVYPDRGHARQYLADPTDSNWHALARAIGLEER